MFPMKNSNIIGPKRIILTNHFYCSQWENSPTRNLLVHPVKFSKALQLSADDKDNQNQDIIESILFLRQQALVLFDSHAAFSLFYHLSSQVYQT